MKKINNLHLAIIAIAIAFVMGGCKKNNEGYTAAPLEAHFTEKSGGTFYVLTATSTFKVPVGITNISTVDQPIKVTITSTTGAVLGTHYTITNPNIVIKAGKAIDSIEVKSNFALYTGGRKDTLKFTISQPSVTPTDYNSTYTLVLRGPCFEGDVNLNEFLGTYTKTIETFGTGAPYGPYITTISAVNQTSPTTGTITVTNIWDNGWGPINFTLDWTNPATRTATVIAINPIAGSNAADVGYTGTMMARPFATGNLGTFSICNQTLQLKMQLGVTGLGYFAGVYTVNMAR